MKKQPLKKKQPMFINNVLKNSVAEKFGVKNGDVLVSINRQNIQDVFDYGFVTVDTHILLELKRETGEIVEIEVQKNEYEDLGIEFENPMMDEPLQCCNKCIFCFIDQLPKGMRDTLYFRDDDPRLSFSVGNYVTLTNVKADEMERIIKYRMSPMNVSIHSTNPSLRVFMMNNKNAGDILPKLKKLINGGIAINGQIVLCPGINDGKELDRTLKDLYDFCPGIESISVVPVGLTKFREGLYPLLPYNKESSSKVIAQIKEWQHCFWDQHGAKVVYAADEFYIMAEEKIPEASFYEGFPQIENGVGKIALFEQQFNRGLKKIKKRRIKKGRTDVRAPNVSDKDVRNCCSLVSIATGVSVYKYIKEFVKAIEKEFSDIKAYVYPIENDFFGKSITVSGLITGSDLVKSLIDKDLGEELFIPSCMLRYDQDVFLDDLTIADVERQLGIKVTQIYDGEEFVTRISNIENF